MDTVWAAIGALATLAAAVVAVVTLVALKQDSRDRTRPVMVAMFKHAILTKDYEFHVVNVGQSVARDVRVAFSPALPVLPDDPDGSEPEVERFTVRSLERRYAREIGTMAPGLVFDNLYKDPRNSSDGLAPDDLTVTITYRDDRGRRYSDSYELSIDAMKHQTGSYPSTSSETGKQDRMLKAVEYIARGIGRA